MSIFDNLPADWFDKVLDLIRECVSGTEPVESIKARLRNPGRREYASILRGNRRAGLRGRELHEETDRDWQSLLSASDDEIAFLIESAREKKDD